MLIKKSITIKKHRTSLSLEKEFWDALKIISYKDQFGTDTQIDFINIKLNDELDKKIFDYNKETNLIILN